MEKHWETQPRVPKGNENGGEWTDDKSTNVSSRKNDAQEYYVDYFLSSDEKINTIEKEALPFVEYIDTERNKETFFTTGVQDDALFKIIKTKFGENPPQRLTDAELADSLKNKDGFFIYRGLKEAKYKDEFYDGPLFVGQGWYGNGIYTAVDALDAKTYGANVAVSIVDSDTNFAPENTKELFLNMQKYIREKKEIVKKHGTPEQLDFYKKMSKLISNYGRFVALCGYDAFKANNDKYVVILNRSKLKIGETNERLERIAL